MEFSGSSLSPTQLESIDRIGFESFDSSKTYNLNDTVKQSSLNYIANRDGITGAFNPSDWDEVPSGSSVAGLNTQIQFNDGGFLGSSADFIYDKINKRLGIGVASPTAIIDISDTTSATGEFVDAMRLNYSGGGLSDSSTIGMKFDISSGNDTAKGGIAFERTASNGRGKLHVLMSDAGLDDVTLADAVFTFDRTGKIGVGVTDPSAKLDLTSKTGEGECMIRLRHLEDNGTEFKMYQDANNATFETDKAFQAIHGSVAVPASSKIYCANFEKYRNDGTLDFKVHGDGGIEAPNLDLALMEAYSNALARWDVVKQYISDNCVMVS